VSITKKILLTTALLVFLGGVFLFHEIFSGDVEHRESMPRSEATNWNWISFPLVDSATNIFGYFHMTGINHSEEYIRLTVPKDDLVGQINLVTTNSRDPISNRLFQYEKKNIDSSEIMSGPSLDWWDKPLLWWSPGKITNGFYVGNKDSGFYFGAYEIWVDQDTGTLFIFQGD
jgi:hypothetical protein